MLPLTLEVSNHQSFLFLDTRPHQSEDQRDEDNQSTWLLEEFTWKRQGLH